MRILTGLGNPGKKYANNRHNIGFMVLDAIADAHSFTPWREKFQGLISEGTVQGQKILLLKPHTFMNLSGVSVQAAAKFYKVASQDIVVLHDELDLPPGKIKMKKAGGHAGHNGLRSITQHMGADFWRLRIGIGHPGDKNRVSGYVLSDFAKSDHEWIDVLLPKLAEHLGDLAQTDAAKLMQNLSPQQSKPPAPKPKPTERAAQQQTPAPTDTRSALQKLMDKFGS